jgi:uroporphyrinogen III methyltransferase / synthase
MSGAEIPAVCIVGAGAGSGDLLTVRGARRLAEAHAVVHDPDLELRRLDLRDGCRTVGASGTDPEATAAVVAELVQAGRPVVRLMRGDPGDTPETAELTRILSRAGISFEVVPGVPLDRIAAVCAGGPDQTSDASGVEKEPGAARWTLVGTPRELRAGLDGRQLPVGDAAAFMLVTAPGLPRQRRWSGDAEAVRDALASLPLQERHVLLEIGAASRKGFSWFESRPLFGRRIGVTRPLAQSAALIRRLEALGADPVVLPTIRIRPMDDDGPLVEAARSVADYDWVVFTSANGVDAFWAALVRGGADSRALAGVQICAIGPGTAAALERQGVRADLLPEQFVAEGVIDALTRTIPDLTRVRILLPRASEARAVLPESLRGAGATVDEVAAYHTVPEPSDRTALRAIFDEGPLDYLTFTSSSTVRNFTAMFGTELGRARIVSIGPITSATARECGLAVDLEADPHTVDGIVDAMVGAEGSER